MHAILQDIRFALRAFRANRGFTAVAVLALAIGVGANSAMFSVIDAVLLRPLPFRDPDRLVQVWEGNPSFDFGTNDIPTSVPNFVDWRERSEQFEDMAAFRYRSIGIMTGEGAEHTWGAEVTPNLFAMFGVEPLLGRGFQPGEGVAGADRVALLSAGFWRRRFGADPSILGRPIVVDGNSYTVLGVMPDGFQFPLPPMLPIHRQRSAELWTPLATEGANTIRGSRNVGVVGRLARGATIESAFAEMAAIEAQLAIEYPGNNSGWEVRLVPLERQVSGEVRPALLILLGAVFLVLLISCANVAHLLLARGVTRSRELGIRRALGATQSRLVRQHLTESLVLAVAGGCVGLALAYWGVDMILTLVPVSFPRLPEITIDGRVVTFTLLLSVITGLAFGALPAWRAGRTDPQTSLKEGGRGGTLTVRGRKSADVLVIAEVAIAVVLLTGAGLLMRSFVRVLAIPLGFSAEHVLVGGVHLPPARYPERSQQAAFFRELLERLRTVPGVQSASAAAPLPFTETEEFVAFYREGRVPTRADDAPVTRMLVIDPQYPATMQIRLARGRLLEPVDDDRAPGVTLINQTMANRFWPGEDPIGSRITIDDSESWLTVVGVLDDVRHSGLEAVVQPEVYVSYLQNPWPALFLVLRSEGDPARLASSLRATVQSIDGSLPVVDVRTMDRLVSESLAERRLNTVLFGVFAALALVLAAVGLYGVIVQVVSRRTHEIGVRVALGARPSDVLRLIVRHHVVPVMIGIVLGLLGALAGSKLLAGLLYQLPPYDPLTLAGVPVALLTVAVAASIVPAQRALRIHPIEALRAE